MKPSAWIKGVFVFLAGGVVGGVVVMLSVGDLSGGEGADASPETAPVELKTEQSRLPRGSDALVEAEADDEALAGHLEQARFDNDWFHVSGVARVLRDRKGRTATATPVTAGVEPAVKPGEKPSLVALERALRQRSFLKDLETRENPATRAARDGTPRDQERRLTELFLGPVVQPTDEVTRSDAAFLLAGYEGGRELLLRTLGEPDEVRARLAAGALARVDSPEALRALGQRLANEPDPKLRLLVCQALGDLSAPAPLAAAALARAARQDRDLTVRVHAALGLGRCELDRDEQLRRTLTDLLESDTEDAALRRACARAIREHRRIAQVAPEALLRSLTRVLERAQGELLREVALALGEAGRDTTPLETALANARDPAAREALEAAIAAIKSRITVAPR
ncbi:MAG: HEAT repeat domain-containing protein [Planctomycetota bacterium]